ncbi:alcohol dehydrogenase catalytic domain-containing protein [Streptomyces sp. NPDC020141]|uniref:alcohol dehydrogenase catalytic domain-containing protein n=1 Tax=Streptomyces sp. NPDC020141 TaxID=3365065 RepID=UPI00379FC382
MRATFMYGPGDVRVEEAPDPRILEPTDAIVRITLACVCGSDLHPYRSMDASDEGVPMGHEFLGVVEETGSEVTGLSKGDFVVSPFAFADNTCAFCRDGFQTACPRGGWYGAGGVGGAQAEAVRVPQAAGTLVRLPGDVDAALLPSLLALSDVYLTGYHAAHMGRVSRGKTVTVIGDGAVGLSAVLASWRMDADRIILMGRHESRVELGREWGAAEVVAERGEDGVARVLELTDGEGSPVVLEAVGLMPAYEQAYGIVRPGGVISRVGAPQYEEAPVGFGSLFGKNAGLTGGPAPVRAYIDEAVPDVLEGRIDPGRVFDGEVPLERVAEAYRAMDDRTRLKVIVRP